MKTRTLSMFCEENNVNLEELSEKIGISSEELKSVAELSYVPSAIADRITPQFALPESYFIEDLDKPARIKNDGHSFGYFFVVALLWSLATGVVMALYMNASSFVINFLSGEMHITASKISDIISAVLNTAITVLSCIIVSKIVEKKNANTGNFGKYKYFFSIIPAYIMMILNLPIRYFYERLLISNEQTILVSNMLTLSLIPVAISLVTNFGTDIICAFMMQAAFGESNDRKQKTLDGLFISAAGVAVLYYLLLPLLFPTSGNDGGMQWIDSVVRLLITLTVIGGGFLGAKKKPELDKLWFTVIPLLHFTMNLLSAVVPLTIRLAL